MRAIDKVLKGKLKNSGKFIEKFEKQVKDVVRKNPNMVNKTGWPQ